MRYCQSLKRKEKAIERVCEYEKLENFEFFMRRMLPVEPLLRHYKEKKSCKNNNNNALFLTLNFIYFRVWKQKN